MLVQYVPYLQLHHGGIITLAHPNRPRRGYVQNGALTQIPLFLFWVSAQFFFFPRSPVRLFLCPSFDSLLFSFLLFPVRTTRTRPFFVVLFPFTCEFFFPGGGLCIRLASAAKQEKKHKEPAKDEQAYAHVRTYELTRTLFFRLAGVFLFKSFFLILPLFALGQVRITAGYYRDTHWPTEGRSQSGTTAQRRWRYAQSRPAQPSASAHPIHPPVRPSCCAASSESELHRQIHGHDHDHGHSHVPVPLFCFFFFLFWLQLLLQLLSSLFLPLLSTFTYFVFIYSALVIPLPLHHHTHGPEPQPEPEVTRRCASITPSPLVLQQRPPLVTSFAPSSRCK